MRKLNRLFTVTLSVTATAGFALYGCQSLWDSQLVADPNNCVVNNIPCERGFVCDVDTKHCVPEVGDMAGVDASSSDIDGGTMIDMSTVDMAIDPSPFAVQIAKDGNTEINSNFNAIFGKSSSQIWVAGNNSVIVSGNGTAGTWNRKSLIGSNPQHYLSVWTADGIEIWVGGTNFIGSFNAMQSSVVARIALGVSPSLIRTIWGSDTKNVYFSDEKGKVYHPKNQVPAVVAVDECNGQETRDAVQWIWGLNANSIWAFGEGQAAPLATAARTISPTECGTLGNVVLAPSISKIRSAHGIDATKVWLLSAGNIHSVNLQTMTLSQSLYSSGNVLNGIWAISPNDVWAVGGNGTIIHYDGTKWDAIPAPITKSSQNLRAVWAANANDVYIVGDGGTILKKYK